MDPRALEFAGRRSPSGGQPVILAMMPFSPDMNLGRAYNESIQLLPADDDWAIFLDHDAMHTTRSWFNVIKEAIEFLPRAGAFVAVTNRIDAAWQRAAESDRDNHDIGYHTAIGLERLKKRSLLDISGTKGFGGVCFALSKGAWKEAGGFSDGLLCVDHSIHFGLQRARRSVWLLENLYVYHRRRAFVGNLPTNAPIAKKCPCRGAERMPTERLYLP